MASNCALFSPSPCITVAPYVLGGLKPPSARLAHWKPSLVLAPHIAGACRMHPDTLIISVQEPAVAAGPTKGLQTVTHPPKESRAGSAR